MNSFEPDPPRWKDRAGQANLADARPDDWSEPWVRPRCFPTRNGRRIEAATRKAAQAGLAQWWPAMAVALLVSGGDLCPRGAPGLDAALAAVPRPLHGHRHRRREDPTLRMQAILDGRARANRACAHNRTAACNSTHSRAGAAI